MPVYFKTGPDSGSTDGYICMISMSHLVSVVGKFKYFNYICDCKYILLYQMSTCNIVYFISSLAVLSEVSKALFSYPQAATTASTSIMFYHSCPKSHHIIFL